MPQDTNTMYKFTQEAVKVLTMLHTHGINDYG